MNIQQSQQLKKIQSYQQQQSQNFKKIQSYNKEIKQLQEKSIKFKNKIPRQQQQQFKSNDKNWIGAALPIKKTLQNNPKLSKNIIAQNYSANFATNNSPNMGYSKNQQLSKISSISKKSNSNDSPLKKLSNSLYKAQQSQSKNYKQSQQKTPVQLMSDIFRGIGLNYLSNSKAYYSKQSQDNLCQLLSNKNKMNNYLKKLANQIQDATSPQVQKNYQILYTLLHQLGQADLQIHQDENGVKICFNRVELAEKQKQIQRLQKQLEEKNKQTQKIVEEYQGVIRNFNDVIQRLIQEKKH